MNLNWSITTKYWTIHTGGQIHTDRVHFQTDVVKRKLVKPTVFLVFKHLPIITHETGKHIEKTELEIADYLEFKTFHL